MGLRVILLLPDTCILYFLPVIRGRRRGGRVWEREEEGEREENFLWIEEVLGISDHVDMWRDLEGLRKLVSTHEI